MLTRIRTLLVVPILCSVSLAQGTLPDGLAAVSTLGGTHYNSDLLNVTIECRLWDRELRMVRRERKDTSSDWDFSARTFTTSYRITGVSGTDGGRVLLVSGVSARGTDVVEKWTFPFGEGRVLGAVRPLIPVVVRGGAGQPLPTAAQVGFLQPGPTLSFDPDDYSGPVHRADIPSPTRSVVLDWPTNAFIKNLVLDPEQRFFLMQFYLNDTVFRVDLVGASFPLPPSPTSAEAVFLASGPGAIPLLAKKDVVLSLWDVPTEGRMLLMVRGAGFEEGETHAVVHIDANNDGNWDTSTEYEFGAWFASSHRENSIYTFPDVSPNEAF